MLGKPNLTDGRQPSRSRLAASPGNGLKKAEGDRMQSHYLGPHAVSTASLDPTLSPQHPMPHTRFTILLCFL